MKAILIDVRNQDVREVEYIGKIEDISLKLECELFTVPVQFDNGDAVYVDDESLLRNPYNVPGAFRISVYPHQPLFGHGLIMGHDQEGETQDVRLTVEQVRDMVTFLSPEETIYQHGIISQRPIEIYFK